MRASAFFLCFYPIFGQTATLNFNWDVTWVNAQPDGYSRPVIGINGKWPCPTIEANVGDEIVVNVVNSLGNQNTTLHWHGISQRGSNVMDGANMATQCPIPPGSAFTYRFKVDTAGTFWWHSHVVGQYMDGLRGPLIVYGLDPYANEYDAEIILTISDWYHDQAPLVASKLLSKENIENKIQEPNSVLVDESGSTMVQLDAEKIYKIRVISMAGVAAIMLQFDSHVMTIIEVDGVHVHKRDATQIRVSPAQRYSFLLKPKTVDMTLRNYAFLASLDMNDDFLAGRTIWNCNATGYLVYDELAGIPGPFSVRSWVPLDDKTLIPIDNQQILPDSDNIIAWDLTMGLDEKEIPRAYLNGTTYLEPSTPTLYTVLSSGKSATDASIYGEVNPVVVYSGQIVDIVLNNLTPFPHPFHLHGHHFQVLDRPEAGTGRYTGLKQRYPSIPMRRDTVDVYPNSYLVIRFRADNPGVQLFHCHIEPHVAMGMTGTIVEAPAQIQASAVVPRNQLAICKAQGISTKIAVGPNEANLSEWISDR